jgi:hypothetical protein
MKTTENIIAESDYISSDNFAAPGYYTLTEDESDRWGANAGEGCEAEDKGDYRRAVRQELQAVADAQEEQIEITVCDRDGNDWIADVICPTHYDD